MTLDELAQRTTKDILKVGDEQIKKMLREESYLDKYETDAERQEAEAKNKLNYFAFETQTRNKLREFIDPVVASQEDDRKVMSEINITFKEHNERLNWIEGLLSDKAGKNVFFDRVMEKVVNADVARLEFMTDA